MAANWSPFAANPQQKPDQERAAQRRIVVCDQNPVLADGLVLILQADAFLSTFHITSTRCEDFEAEMKLAPDVLIVNPWQTVWSRQAALDQFIGIPDKTFVIGYCSEISIGEVHQLISMGFRGVVPTTVRSDELVKIVSSVAFGGIYISDIYQKNGSFLVAPMSAEVPVVEALTEREVDVLHRLARGNSMKEVAAALKISPKTADTYKTRAVRKLNLHTRADIVRYAIDAGWLT